MTQSVRYSYLLKFKTANIFFFEHFDSINDLFNISILLRIEIGKLILKKAPVVL